VPEDQLDASRLETAAQGLPHNARLGFELFDTPNWAGSDFTEKVNYQRALEGELERTLQTLSEVESVRVHLVLPRESLFLDQQGQAKASVIVKTRGGQLSEQAQRAVPQLVASSVDGLRPENVTVVDADTDTSLIHSRPGGGEAAYGLDDELSKTLIKTLEPVVGTGRVRASVHVEYDLSTSENTDEVYDPKATAAVAQQKSEETINGPAPAGVPGTSSNVPGGSAPAVASLAETQTSHSESANYAVSKSVRHTTMPAGRLKRVAAAVLVDDAAEVVDKNGAKTVTWRKRTNEEMKQIGDLASAAIGIDAQRGDLLSLQNLSFQERPSTEVIPPTRMEKTRQIVTQWFSLLRYGGILLLFFIVYFLILRPVKKQALAAFRELPAQAVRSPKEVSHAGATAKREIEIELPEGSEQGLRAVTLKKQLMEKVKAEPKEASRLVQSWMRESAK